MSEFQLQDALKSAKYNEAVILTVTPDPFDEQSQSSPKVEERREIVLVPKLDSNNGGVIWKDALASKSSSEIDIGISRHIRTKKWVMPMLNDDNRNKLYDKSIRRACEVAIENILVRKNESKDEKQILVVLDIGSGTGLLAMMAAKHSLNIAKNYHTLESVDQIQVEITSVEMASAMARLASKTISNNGLGDNIHLVEAHSSDESFTPFAHSSSKAHLCTSELLESGLLGEGIIPAMRDAWNRHLCKGAIVIPQKARVYAQVIDCLWITNFQGPNIWKNINLSTTSDPNSVLLGGSMVVPLHVEGILNQEEDDDSNFTIGMSPSDEARVCNAKLLSEPNLVLEFDFTSRDSIPTELGRSIKKELKASETGKAHGVLFWWEIDLYDQTYTIGKHWQDHWQQCVFVFGSDEECQELEKDELFILTSSHDDYTISFKIQNNISEQNHEHQMQKRQKISNDIQRHISFERALQLSDEGRLYNLSQAIQTALDVKGVESCVLDVSDFSLCALIAATQFHASNVTSIESSSGDIPMLSAMVSQIGNKLPKDGCNFQILNAHLENLRLEHLQGNAVDVIMSEPYFEILHGWNLASALNYYYIVKALKQRGLVKIDAISVPSYASIKCCAIEFHKCVIDAHCGLNVDEDGCICNFKHDDAVLYGQNFHTHGMIFPLWQYKWKRLSEPVILAKIVYEGSVDNDDSSMRIIGDGVWSKVKMSTPGTCHAIVHWVDYGVRVQDGKGMIGHEDTNEADFEIISTGNRYNQQEVRMLSSPITIPKDDIESMELLVKPSFQDLVSSEDIEDYSFKIKLNEKM